MGLDEALDGGVSFRRPRTAVKQPRRLQKRRQIDGCHLESERAGAIDRVIEQSFVFRITEIVQLVPARDADPQATEASIVDRARVGVLRIEAFGGEQQRVRRPPPSR